MKQAELEPIIRAAYDKWLAYDIQENTPATFCNKFVMDVCTSLGYTKLQGLRANDMHRLMVSESNKDNGDFIRLPQMGLYDKINDVIETPVIIASKPNPTGSGHVCILLPGQFNFSGKLGHEVPVCANIGRTNFWGKGISYAFTVDPEYFELRRP